MKKDRLPSLLKRAESRPKRAQQNQELRGIEGDFFASPVTMAELYRAHTDALRDKGISIDDWRQRLGA